jgi:predicted MFS family arabinose efflux permease
MGQKISAPSAKASIKIVEGKIVQAQTQDSIRLTAPPGLSSRSQLLLLGFFRVFRSVSAGMIAIAFPYLVLNTLHRGALFLGLIYTSGAIATGVLGFAIGFVTDIWSRKGALILVGAMLPLSAALVFYSQKPLVLFTAAIIGGFSATGSLMGGGVGGAAQPVQNAVIAVLASNNDRTFYFSIFTFISGMFAAVGTLLARLVSVHDAFGAASIISLVGVACLAPLQFPKSRGRLNRLTSKEVIGKFSFTGALNGFSQGLVTPFLIPFMLLVYHVPKSEMSIYGFIAGTIGSIALLAAPRLDRLFGFVRSIAITRGLGTALLVLLPLWHSFHFAIIVYFLTPALRVAALPAQQNALVGMVADDELGRALALNQVTRLGASASAITFTGRMFSDADIGVPFYVYGAIMAVNILLYFRFFDHPRHEPMSE